MTPNHVANFIEWWTSLSPLERRERIAQARERKARWRQARARVLFGLLEDDAVNETLERERLPVTVRGFTSDEIIARFRNLPDARAFVDTYVDEHGGVLVIEED